MQTNGAQSPDGTTDVAITLKDVNSGNQVELAALATTEMQEEVDLAPSAAQKVQAGPAFIAPVEVVMEEVPSDGEDETSDMPSKLVVPIDMLFEEAPSEKNDEIVPSQNDSEEDESEIYFDGTPDDSQFLCLPIGTDRRVGVFVDEDRVSGRIFFEGPLKPEDFDDGKLVPRAGACIRGENVRTLMLLSIEGMTALHDALGQALAKK